jgi:lipid-A-disaccharide synthase
MGGETPSPQNEAIEIFVSAGDPSGDIAGGHLLKQLIEINSSCRFFGLGGRRMAALGQLQFVPGEKLAVIGFWEVAKKIGFFKNLLEKTIWEITTRRPKAIILIDYPGFNLRLAKKIKALNIPIIYYISPQIWAWGGKRIKLIKKLVDLMLLILPFEKEIYDRADLKNQFVGHYLLDDIPPEYIKAPYNIESHLISLLPGSRPQEIEKMLPVLLDTARLLHKDKKYRFVVAAVEGNFDYKKYLNDIDFPIEIQKGKTRELVAQSRLVITSSGTATLETGIIGRPMVVIYRTGTITYLIARSVVKLDMIALINISAGRKIVAELIQSDASPSKIADEALKILDNPQAALNIVSQLNQVTDNLGGPGAGKRAAQAVWEFIKC